MLNWTRFDPGAGTVAVCETGKRWTDAQSADLADAQSTVSTILRDLDDIWTGESADAFRARAQELHTRLEESSEAMDAAGKAIVAYGDAVAEIARKAEPLQNDLAGAELILNGKHNDDLFGTDAEGMQRQYEAQLQATSDAQEAADALAALAAERAEADQTLAVLLARVSSAAWGGLDCTAAPHTGTPRDLANARVWDLLEDFRTGDGDRGIVLGPDDPFVSTLMRSDHINSVR
ncbi:MAG: WXG100 family type VII secretion target, partial [Microbacterium sp.]|uniref:WXG100 family type VII secretion target n=1 Tax=Microbacterium sp. TaxID=51671 RepID=UPI003F94C353